MNKRPTLSLCMIVRDEAEMLPRFFAAARGLWDELVVVDTGSSDDTVAIATQAGARVLHHAWVDDFAAARNASLEAATGDFILYLDADEMVTPELASEVRAAIADPMLGAARLVMRNPMPNGHFRVTPLLRLFRRDSRIRFRHRIHEEVATAVTTYLRMTSFKLVDLAGEVMHLGYTRERATARDKKQRDLRLLEMCVADDAGDFYSWFKLLELARFWGDVELGREKAKACLAELVRRGPSAVWHVPFGGELLSLAISAHLADDARAAARLMDIWRPFVQPSAAFYLRRGELAEQLGDFARAIAEFQRCLAIDADTADRQLATVRPLMGLARVALACNDLETAWRHIDRAMAHNPADPEAVAAAVSICKRVGGDAMVNDLVTAYAQQYGDPAPITRVLSAA